VAPDRLPTFAAVDPSSAGLFLDFDGTLSEIVQIPSDARPLEGVADALSALARDYAVVAVVSGRSAHELLGWLGPTVEIWGVHGAQRTIEGRVELSARVAPHGELMSQVKREADRLVAELKHDGVLVEDKGIAVGLHFRTAQDVETARRQLDAIAQLLVDRYGVVRAEGRLTYELRPPVELSKASVVLDRAREASLSGAAFVGDDLVDLPAFDALDLLEAEGVTTLRVAVRSDEAPEELLDRADVVVDGPRGTLTLLKRLTH
jgi:trehalose 6-phosphate phosphatase